MFLGESRLLPCTYEWGDFDALQTLLGSAAVFLLTPQWCLAHTTKVTLSAVKWQSNTWQHVNTVNSGQGLADPFLKDTKPQALIGQRHRVRSVFITQHLVIEPRPSRTRDAFLTMYSLHVYLPSTQRTLRMESPFQILSTQHELQQINTSKPNRLTMPFCAAATDGQESGYLVLNQAIIETAVMTDLVNCA